MQLSQPAAGTDAAESLSDLMEEPASGHNHGRAASTDPEALGRHLPLGTEEWQARDLMQHGGWGVIDTRYGSTSGKIYGAGDMGMTAHRGVLHPDEYVDMDSVRAAAYERLGFTPAEVHAVYRQGRISNEQGELRARIDARLLALSRAGAQVHVLGGLLGLSMSGGGDGGSFCPSVRNALTRARAAEQVAA